MINRWFLSLLAIMLGTPCCADVIIYDEAISGDLAPQSAINHNLDETLSLFVLTPGINRILGTMAYRNGPGIIWDIDAFAITIPSGYELSALGFDATRTTGKATSFTMAVSPGIAFNNSNIDNPPRPPILGTITTQIPSSNSSVPFPAFFPLAAGDYAISFDQGTLLDGEFQSNPFNWTAHLTVSAVPEPGAIVLLSVLTIPSLFHRKR